jgi:hypothetical protein
MVGLVHGHVGVRHWGIWGKERKEEVEEVEVALDGVHVRAWRPASGLPRTLFSALACAFMLDTKSSPQGALERLIMFERCSRVDRTTHAGDWRAPLAEKARR